MNRVLQFTWIETKLYLRQFYSPFFALAFPVMLLLLFGTIWGNVPSEFYGGFGAVDVSVANFTGIVLAVNGLMSFPLSLTEYRERKVLKRLQATPASPALLLVSQFLVNIGMTIVGILALIMVGRIGYGARLPASFWPVLVAALVTLIAMFSIGMLIASLIRSSKGANILANLLYFPMIFLSGASMPIQMFPEGLKQAANVLPLTHGVRMISGVWLGGSLGDFTSELIVLGAVAVVFTTVSALLFRWE